MNGINKEWIKTLVSSMVKPLRVGKISNKEADGINHSMNNLYPDGEANKFRMTQPFGVVSNVPKGITGFFQSLFGSGYENVILGLIHHDRPIVNNVGEVVFYSTDSSGKQIKTTITLTNDGKLVINCPSELQVVCTKATVTAPDVIVNSENATLNASVKTVINSPLVEVGGGALEKIINGETFMTLYNAHTHAGNLGYPTSPPNTPMTAAQLSAKVKAAK